MSKWNSPEWEALYSGDACPICCEGRPLGIVAELNVTYLTSSPESPMWGYCCLVLKRHAVELYDLSADEASALMKDMRRVAETLQAITSHYRLHLVILRPPDSGREILYVNPGITKYAPRGE